MAVEPVSVDRVAAQARERRIETVFRDGNVYDRTIALPASGRVDLKPPISATFAFDDSVAAFRRAARVGPGDVTLPIRLPG